MFVLLFTACSKELLVPNSVWNRLKLETLFPACSPCSFAKRSFAGYCMAKPEFSHEKTDTDLLGRYFRKLDLIPGSNRSLETLKPEALFPMVQNHPLMLIYEKDYRWLSDE